MCSRVRDAVNTTIHIKDDITACFDEIDHAAPIHPPERARLRLKQELDEVLLSTEPFSPLPPAPLWPPSGNTGPECPAHLSIDAPIARRWRIVSDHA
jgi:hypothetical protein